MLFQSGYSSLVRLSDCLKMGVGNAFETAKEVTSLHRKHAGAFKDIREIARKQLADMEAGETPSDDELKAASSRIPLDEALYVTSLQGRLHAETLSVILTSCFTLESYINSLGFLLLRDQFCGAFERSSTLTKWERIGKFKSEHGFDKGKPPFQELKILFRFRDDHVHDKVAAWGSDVSKTRYNGKLPDPLAGLLTLSHAVFACDTYWGMVLRVHELVGLPLSEFHRHYNLRPWFNDEFEQEVRQAAAE